MKANSALAFQMMMFYADEFKVTEKRMKLMTLMTAKEKVAFSIITIINALGLKLMIPHYWISPHQKKTLQALPRTTYETVIRVLGTLEKDKVIALEGKSIRS